MGKAELIKAEESLKDFFINEYRVENERARNLGRINDIVDITNYRRLTVSINKHGAGLLIAVRISSYTAIFNINEGKMIEGSMPVEDIRLIETWLSTSRNKELLKSSADKKEDSQEDEQQ